MEQAAHVDILTLINQKISDSNNEVKESLITAEVEVEVNRRKNILRKAFTAIQQLEKDLKKIQPDHRIKDKDGNVLVEGFTDQKLKEQKKLGEKLDKLVKSFQAALTEQNKFNELEKAVNEAGAKNE